MNMSLLFSLLLVVCASALSLLFSSLTYSLRELSRPRLTEKLESIGMSQWTEKTLDLSGELIFVTAIGRLFANLLVFIGVLHVLRVLGLREGWTLYLSAAAVTSFL